jgi:hypothetical protein
VLQIILLVNLAANLGWRRTRARRGGVGQVA